MNKKNGVIDKAIIDKLDSINIRWVFIGINREIYINKWDINGKFV